MMNRHFTSSADEHREGASDSSVKRHDDEFRTAEDEFINVLLGEFATIETKAARLASALKDFVDNDATPEPNCSCHISPPCSDCVEFAGMREIVKNAKNLLS